MKKGFLLPFLLVLVFFHAGEALEAGDVIDWATDIIITNYVQDFVKKCGLHVVRGALHEACNDLEIEGCRRVAKEARDSYFDVSYYCDRLGSMFYQVAKKTYQVAKETGSLAIQATYYTVKTSALLLGYTLDYTGYALSSGAKYLLE